MYILALGPTQPPKHVRGTLSQHMKLTTQPNPVLQLQNLSIAGPIFIPNGMNFVYMKPQYFIFRLDQFCQNLMSILCVLYLFYTLTHLLPLTSPRIRTVPHSLLTFSVHNLLSESICCHLQYLLNPPEQNHVCTLHLRTQCTFETVNTDDIVQKPNNVMPMWEVYRYTPMLKKSHEL